MKGKSHATWHREVATSSNPTSGGYICKEVRTADRSEGFLSRRRPLLRRRFRRPSPSEISDGTSFAVVHGPFSESKSVTRNSGRSLFSVFCVPTISWIPEAAIRFKCDSEEEVHGVEAGEPGLGLSFVTRVPQPRSHMNEPELQFEAGAPEGPGVVFRAARKRDDLWMANSSSCGFWCLV